MITAEMISATLEETMVAACGTVRHSSVVQEIETCR
jgi:hypothetical protein